MRWSPAGKVTPALGSDATPPPATVIRRRNAIAAIGPAILLASVDHATQAAANRTRRDVEHLLRYIPSLGKSGGWSKRNHTS